MTEQPTYEELKERVHYLERVGSEREREQQFLLEILQLINNADNADSLLPAIAHRLKDWSGCDAIGIRIRKGDDFPYFKTIGFPEEFIRTENHLCFYDESGEAVCDPDGSAILECLCGNILYKRMDPLKIFFTVDGNFCTNCTSDLTSIPMQPEQKRRIRNRCNSFGYESVALIPLMSGKEMFGLIQINDRRKGRFSANLVALYRRIADNMAGFLARKKAMEMLEKSEDQLRTLINTLPDLIWLKNPDGVYISCNTRFSQFFGAPEDQIIGKTDYDFVDKKLANFFRKKDQEVLEAKTPRMNEEEVTFASDGHRELLETIKTPIFNSNGEITGVLGIARNITQRRKNQVTLQESHNRYRSLFMHSPDAIFVNVDNSVSMVNQACLTMFGADDPATMVGCSIFDLFHPDFHQPIRERIRQLVQQNISVPPKEETIVRVDGSLVDVEVMASPFPLGGSTAIHVILKDITERRRAEKEIAASERRYRTLFETASEGILVTEIPTRKLLYANPAICSTLGYSSEELCRLRVDDILPADQLQELLAVFNEHVSGELSRGTGIPFVTSNSRIAYLDVNSSLIEIDSRKAIVGFFTDVTERIQLEKEKEKLESQLYQAQKMESIGRLAGGVAHDLNNLLSPILGFGDLLIDELSPGDDRRESVEEILQAGYRARDLVRQLLAFSKKQALAFKPTDLNDTIRRFENLLRRTISENIKIKMKLASDTRAVMADVGQIEQVIMNLAVNAADAMPGGGIMTIETRLADLDASLSDIRPGCYVMLSISDTGCGMDSETQTHVFEPFFSTKGDRGTGMGLSTVYGIVKQHEGHISIYSELDLGTTFRVFLPVTDPGNEKKETPCRVSIGTEGSETVLLVEDNNQVRRMAEAILKRKGYRVLSAENGKEALSILKKEGRSVELLLTDVIMPGMNGRDLYKLARKQSPGLKVLFMSGYADGAISESGVLTPGANFIEKPFGAKPLTTKVRGILDNDFSSGKS